MRVLGAILAGGQARRFGSDKALAEVDGVPLIELARRSLAPQCAEVVVAGREHPGLRGVPDRPTAGLGPLGGLAGALAYAEANAFGCVLTTGCDMPSLPPDLLERLGKAPAIAAAQPLLGLWPAHLARALVAYLEEGDDRSLRGWAAACGARRVLIEDLPPNINTPADLLDFKRQVDPRSSR